MWHERVARVLRNITSAVAIPCRASPAQVRTTRARLLRRPVALLTSMITGSPNRVRIGRWRVERGGSFVCGPLTSTGGLRDAAGCVAVSPSRSLDRFCLAEQDPANEGGSGLAGQTRLVRPSAVVDSRRLEQVGGHLCGGQRAPRTTGWLPPRCGSGDERLGEERKLKLSRCTGLGPSFATATLCSFVP